MCESIDESQTEADKDFLRLLYSLFSDVPVKKPTVAGAMAITGNRGIFSMTTAHSPGRSHSAPPSPRHPCALHPLSRKHLPTGPSAV